MNRWGRRVTEEADTVCPWVHGRSSAPVTSVTSLAVNFPVHALSPVLPNTWGKKRERKRKHTVWVPDRPCWGEYTFFTLSNCNQFIHGLNIGLLKGLIFCLFIGQCSSVAVKHKQEGGTNKAGRDTHRGAAGQSPTRGAALWEGYYLLTHWALILNRMHISVLLIFSLTLIKQICYESFKH